MHAAGEVKDPKKNLPLGLTLGLILITTVYLLTNYAYLRVVPLHEMAVSESLAAIVVAEKTFGTAGGKFISLLMMISILGALGGLIMTFPRLLYAAGVQYSEEAERRGNGGEIIPVSGNCFIRLTGAVRSHFDELRYGCFSAGLFSIFQQDCELFCGAQPSV